MKNYIAWALTAVPLMAAAASQPGPLTLEKSIPLPGISGGFNHHSADGEHHRVFVCASGNSSVEVVDLVSGKIIHSLPGDKPSATCFAADLGLLCVSRGSRVQIYDATSYQLLSAVVLPCSVDEMRYDERMQQLLAGCMTPPDEGIGIVDLPSRKLLTEIKSAHPQGFCTDSEGKRIFVSTPRGGKVTTLDRQRHTVANEWILRNAAGNYPIDFDGVAHRLFVGCRRPAVLVVLDSDNGREVARAEIDGDTDDLSFDHANKRVYVVCGEGVIAVIQQNDSDHYQTVQRIATAPNARNGILVPETGQFCVTAPAHDNQPAALLVYSTQRSQP